MIPSPSRLFNLAYRILLHDQAGQLVPLLVSADLQGDNPWQICTTPAGLTPPKDAPEGLVAQWGGLMSAIGQLHNDFAEAGQALSEALTQPGAQLPPLPELGEGDRRALMEELLTELVRAERLGSNPALTAEQPLWARAVAVAWDGDLQEETKALALRLMAQLPEEREGILARLPEGLAKLLQE